MPQPLLRPYWKTTDGETVRFYLGHVTDVLRRMPPQSVQCVVTSPPYWGLRDYGTAKWEGGRDPDCLHKHEDRGDKQYLDRNGNAGSNNTTWQGAKRHSTAKLGSHCLKCGAERVGDLQLGSEPSPDCGTQGKAQCGGCFVCSMVAVFREVYRVLRDDGTLWLNLGDSYTSGGRGDFGPQIGKQQTNKGSVGIARPDAGLPGGNLVGAPWRVALALQANGWILRQDIVWHKPAPMPESVRNRCTKAHEYVFLLTKRQVYYCDMEAIKIEDNPTVNIRDKAGEGYHADYPHGERFSAGVREYGEQGRSNKRSVWTVSSQGYEGAHFATYPPKLIEPCILAGTSAKGACVRCGAPWARVTERTKLKRNRPNDYVKRNGAEGTGNGCANSVAGVETTTTGWEPTCKCGVDNTRPCVVLDPFIGSGTTAVVAVENNRRCWGIDLSEKYLSENAVPRVKGALLAYPNKIHLAGVVRNPVVLGMKP